MALKENRYYITDKKNQEWLLIQNGEEITGGYITPAEMKKLDPANRYTIVGEVLEGHNVKKKTCWNVNTGGESALSLPVNPTGAHSAHANTIVGYIPCGENEYIQLCKKNTKRLFIVLLPLLLLAIALIVSLGALNKIKNQPVDPAEKFEIDSSITDYKGELKRPPDMNTTEILIPGFSNLEMEAGSTHINTFLFNPEDNPCFFQFNVVDKATGDVLYESKLVPPGKGIEGFDLNRTFEAGEYPAVIQFNTHDLEDPTINYNGSEMEITITVK